MEKLENLIAPLIKPLNKIGYYIAYFGITIILLWIGIFKFTPSEAKGIEPLVSNQPLMSWMYNFLSVQAVSCVFGVAEITTALFLVLGLKWRPFRLIGGFFVIFTFLSTLSFLFTTPGMWRIVDGVPVTDFFILKDIVFLGFGGMILTVKKDKYQKVNAL